MQFLHITVRVKVFIDPCQNMISRVKTCCCVRVDQLNGESFTIPTAPGSWIRIVHGSYQANSGFLEFVTFIGGDKHIIVIVIGVMDDVAGLKKAIGSRASPGIGHAGQEVIRSCGVRKRSP